MKYFLLTIVFYSISAWSQNREAILVNKEDLNNGRQVIEDVVLGERDPFQKPKYIQEMEEEAIKTGNVVEEEREDSMVEAIRRWPLLDYKPIAIIWDVKNPKVMVSDKQGTMHLLKKNYRIGNKEGIITAINEGEIIVTEKGLPRVLKIDKNSQTQGVTYEK